MTNRNKALLTVGSIIGGYFSIYFISITENSISTCLFKNLTGIPCAGCGMTRGTLELFKGNIIQSLNYNLLCIPFSLAIVVSIVVLTDDIVNNTNNFFSFIKKDINLNIKILLFLTILISWAINIFRL